MNKSIIEELKRKIQRARDCEYAVRKYLDESFEIPSDVEERLGNEMLYDSMSTNSRIYMWKENFLKTIGKNPFSTNLDEYSEEAIRYMEETSPYCFGIDTEDMMLDSVSSMAAELALYALSIGATDDQVANLTTLLKEKKLSIPSANIMDKSNVSSTEEVKKGIDDIKGTTIDYYQSDSLLGTVMKINDKNVAGFISYLMRNDVMGNPSGVLSGVCVENDGDELFVSEGNHRIFVYKALQTIKNAIRGESEESAEFTVTLMRHIDKGLNFDER